MSAHAAVPPSSRRHVAIAGWLLVCCVMVFVMVVLGGATRLTHSGLSIVEWKPLVGAIPPLSEADWLGLFEKYKLTPEYQRVNVGMDVDAFKSIFWLEYFHRLWGRLIGVVFAVPLVVFILRGWVERGLLPKLILMFVLGGLQGGLGWLMVASGLVDEPRVSHYRLAAHLGAALIIYGYMFWVALDLLHPRPEPMAESQRAPRARAAWGLIGLIGLTIVSGALVAGLRAGLTYNTFPLMDGRFVPEGYLSLSPWYLNPLENIPAVQFDHRLLAETLLGLILLFWWWARRGDLGARARRALNGLAVMAGAQVGLGITTLLLVVPVGWGTAHQGGAVVLLTFALWLAHGLRAERA